MPIEALALRYSFQSPVSYPVLFKNGRRGEWSVGDTTCEYCYQNCFYRGEEYGLHLHWRGACSVLVFHAPPAEDAIDWLLGRNQQDFRFPLFPSIRNSFRTNRSGSPSPSPHHPHLIFTFPGHRVIVCLALKRLPCCIPGSAPHKSSDMPSV